MIHVPAEAERNTKSAAVQINNIILYYAPIGVIRWGY